MRLFLNCLFLFKERGTAMKKYRFIPLMVMLLTVLIFGVCAQTVAEEKATPDKIRVGVCTGLTGNFAGFGTGGAYGIKAAVADINKEGGVYVKEYKKKLPIELIVVDNESDESKAGTLAQELILRDKVHIIVNGMDPPHMRAPIATVCDRTKLRQYNILCN